MDEKGNAYFSYLEGKYTLWYPDDFMKHLLLAGGDVEFCNRHVWEWGDITETIKDQTLESIAYNVLEKYPLAMIHAIRKGYPAPFYLDIMHFAKVDNSDSMLFRQVLLLLKEQGILYEKDCLYFPENMEAK